MKSADGYKVTKSADMEGPECEGQGQKSEKKVPTSFMDGSILGSLVGAKTESILLPHSTPTQGYSRE